MKIKNFIFILLSFFAFSLSAQHTDSTVVDKYDSINYQFTTIVYLDSVVIQASKSGFDVNDFIEMVKTDNSFYKAFKNLRFSEYDFDNHIVFFKKKKKIKAEYQSKAHQYFKDNCRTMKIIEETKNNKFYNKKKKPKYYTGQLYERLFFTKGKICNHSKSIDTKFDTKPKTRTEKYILELKKLIFSPGRKANIPFIGDKTEIFSPSMSKYYDFSISHTMYLDSIPAYVFSAKLKPEYKNTQRKTVIKYLKTYFQEGNFQVLARKYHLKYKTLLYNFDVKMNIKLRKIKEKYYPSFISYDGTWHIAFKKRETCKFQTLFYNFK